MKANLRILILLSMLMLLFACTIAICETAMDALVDRYDKPLEEHDEKRVEMFGEGVSFCHFPGDGYAIILKEKPSDDCIYMWEVGEEKSLYGCIKTMSAFGDLCLTYINYNTMVALQYSKDLAAESYGNVKTFNSVTLFIQAIEKSGSSTATPKVTPKPTVKTTKVTPAKNAPTPKKSAPTKKKITPTRKVTPTPKITPTPRPQTQTPTTAPRWGAWSEWQLTSIDECDTRQVDVKTVVEEMVTYTYDHWHYTHKKNGAQNSYAEYKGSQYVSGSGKWEYYTVNSPLKLTDYKDGQKRYKVNGVSWYHEKRNVTPIEITYYRYRDLIR